MLEVTHKLVRQIFFTTKPAMLIYTINFNHPTLLSLTYTLPGGHKLKAKPKVLASIFRTLSTDQDEILLFRVEHPCTSVSEIYGNKGN